MFKTLTAQEASDLTGVDITRELDKVKSKVFLNDNAAFLGSVMTSLEFEWTSDISTAATNGAMFWWNPEFFMNLEPDTRKTVFIHELWHAALLHIPRLGSRDPKIWNIACVANNTRIAMADGSTKAIQNINSGDEILNVNNGISVVAGRVNSGCKSILEIELDNGSILRCTPDHRILTAHGFKTAAQLAIGIPCFVDSRYAGVLEAQLGIHEHSRHSGSVGHDLPTGGVESLHDRPISNSQTNLTNTPDATTFGSRMGVSGGFDRRGGNNINCQQNDERKAVPTTDRSCVQHMPQNERLVDRSGISLDTPRKQQGMLVLHYENSSDSLEGCAGKTAPLASHQAALSNASASLDGDPNQSAVQVYTNARNAINSCKHPGLEYSRVREIRQSVREETFDLITSDHHYIAEGVVVHNCDIRINNGLENDGYTFKGVEDCCKDQQYGLSSEEDIYDQLMQKVQKLPKPKPMWGSGPCVPTGSGGDQGNQGAQGQPQPGQQGQPDPNQPGNGPGDGQFDSDMDMVPSSRATNMAAVNNVVRAIHQANLAGQPGSVPGGLQEIIDEFLKPIVPWEQLLQKWMQDLLDEDYTWARPNRRYQDIYLPSRFQDEGRLEHLLFAQDTSGSMSQQELKRTNSEIKYIWDKFSPKKLTTLQFDTKIHKVDVFNEGDSYDSMQVEGRGGTDLREVHKYIVEHKPTAVVIFTDLYVDPMKPLPGNTPVLWVTKTKGIQPPFGDLVIMNEKA